MISVQKNNNPKTTEVFLRLSYSSDITHDVFQSNRPNYHLIQSTFVTLCINSTFKRHQTLTKYANLMCDISKIKQKQKTKQNNNNKKTKQQQKQER